MAMSARQRHLMKNYGITLEERELLGEVCFICGRERKEGGKSLSVDHDHVTGKARGILCLRCNRGLAWFSDNPDWLARAADYLRNPPAVRLIGERYGVVGRVNKKKRKKKAPD
jgi:hypothetical protein